MSNQYRQFELGNLSQHLGRKNANQDAANRTHQNGGQASRGFFEFESQEASYGRDNKRALRAMRHGDAR